MVLNPLMQWYLKGRLRTFEKAIGNPIGAQEQLLEYLCGQLVQTGYGASLGHTSPLPNYTAFAAGVPLTDYAGLLPWIEKQMERPSEAVLWPGKLKYVAKSSGTTTGRSKWIPLTGASIQHGHLKAGKDLVSWYYHHHHPARVFSGKSLLVGGSLTTEVPRPGMISGDVSALLMHSLPSWLEYFRVPRFEVATAASWEEKVDRICRETAQEPVTSVSGVPSWTLLILQQLIASHHVKNIHELWPDFEVYYHGGIGFGPYREAFEKLCGKPIQFVEVYNASEGFFGFSAPGDSDMVLHPQAGVFYEFLEIGKRNQGVVVPLEGVRTGIPYEMIISSITGLWRYRMGDVLYFTETRPYRFRLSGRTSGFLNAFGEEVIEQNATEALTQCGKKTGIGWKEYTLGAIHHPGTGTGYHHWIVEPAAPVTPTEAFASILDEELKKINSDYDAKRSAGLILESPKVTFVPPGTFHKWLASEGRLGGQNKVPRIMANNERLNDFLKFIES